ncbi:FDD123 protein [Plectosphaerella plurivora]|uniref:FDD123 protein n=1 Tax=Plectosphaerella plurivora TaxID=936078 RepID=A0A9P8VD90_9PEZI|nr:FDD123 protein [Plectosphaerella plurivora]
MDAIIAARNAALTDNGPQLGDDILSTGGSSWLWAVTALFLVSFLAVAVLSMRPFQNEKIFHYLFSTALLVGTVCYFAQASGLAYEVIAQANQTGRALTRQIHWAKYVNWVVSFPVIVIALGIASGVSWATIFFNVALTWIWIISFLVAAFTQTNYKWGFFVLGLIAWIYLVVNAFVLDGRRGAARVGISGHHTIFSGAVAFLWFMYVLGWGLSDGGNRINVTGSFIWFGILDLLLIPGLGIAFLILSRRWDYGAMNLHFTQYGRVARGGDFPEKAAVGAAGVGAGAAATSGHHGHGHSHTGPATGTGAGAGYGTGATADPMVGGNIGGYNGGVAGGYDNAATTGPTTGGPGYGPGSGPTGTTGGVPANNAAPGQQYV